MPAHLPSRDRHLARSCVAALLVAAAAASAGCHKDREAPKTWLKQLGSADVAERTEALTELRRLKARQAAPQLDDLLRRDPLLRGPIADALGELGDAGSVQPLLDSIQTTVGAGSAQAERNISLTNARIASALGKLGDRRACPALLRLMRLPGAELRYAAVEATARIGCPESIGELARVLDDRSSSARLTGQAIAALGAARSAAAIPGLIHALLVSREGVAFFGQASLELLRFGSGAFEPLLAVLRDEDPAFKAWAEDRGESLSTAHAKVALVLGDLQDPRAAPALIEQLAYEDSDQDPATAHLLTRLVRGSAARALGELGSHEAAAPLSQLFTREADALELDRAVVDALVQIGEVAQARSLWSRSAGAAAPVRALAAVALGLLGGPEDEKTLRAEGDKHRRAYPEGCQTDVRQLGLEAAPSQACEAVARLFDEPADTVAQAGRCAAQTGCWREALGSKPGLSRMRAALELGRLADPAAAEPLVAASQDEDARVRLFALRALEKMAASPAARPAVLRATAALPPASPASAEEADPGHLALRRLQLRLNSL